MSSETQLINSILFAFVRTMFEQLVQYVQQQQQENKKQIGL